MVSILVTMLPKHLWKKKTENNEYEIKCSSNLVEL